MNQNQLISMLINLCKKFAKKGVQQGLTNDHSDNFKDLVLAIRGYTVSDLKSLFERSKAKCILAG